MIQYTKHLRQSIFALMLLVGITACDSSVDEGIDNPELAQLSAFVSDELALSSEQEDNFNTSLQRHGGDRDREPGFLWQVAADAQASWTDEQKEELFARTEEMEGKLSFRGLLGQPGGGGFYGLGGFIGGSRRHGISPDDDVLNLTADQEASLEEIHTTYRESFKALAESFRNEEITQDDFVSQMIALRADKQAEIAAVLTDEQVAALEEYQAERQAAFEAFKEEVRAVRNDVLGLTDDQATAIDALYAEQMEARESLIEQLQAGSITVTELQAEIDLLEEAREDVLNGLLDATQLEVVQIHDALSVRSGKFGHRGKRGGFGRGEGRGHTMNG